LPDALVLARDGKARLSGKGSLSWFCEKKESFLSSQIRLLNKRLLFFERRLEKLESRATKKHGLFASEILASDPHRVFLGAFSKAISRILYSLPSHLLSSRSRFYSEGLAKAIHSVKAQTLSKFKEFSSTQGSACASLPKYRAAVKPSEALSLSRAFSKKEGIPMPLLAKTTH
jgi:hypothetical protein